EYGLLLTFVKMVSVSAGVTVSKVNAEGIRGSFDFDNQRCFISGVGIRPWRGVKLGYGLLFINKRVGNSLNSEAFAVSRRPYYSISLDWDLRKTVPTIKNIFD